MSKLVALDVAILPPPEVARRAIDYSAALPAEGSQGLRLDEEHLTHVTLTQQFVREEELGTAFEHLDTALRGRAPLRLQVTGGGKSGHTLWMTIDKSPELVDLHERLMEALRGLERQEGSPGAFYGDNARMGDVVWVSGYRLKSSFGSYTPHITLGHGAEPPSIPPFAFEATSVAACHLGRFCTCRRVLRRWELQPAAGNVS